MILNMKPSRVSFKSQLTGGFLPYISILVGLYALHNAWVGILLYHFCIVLFLIFNRKSVSFSRVFAGFDARAFVPGLVVCLLAGPAVYVLWPFIRSGDGVLVEWLALHHLTGLAWLLFLPYFSVVHPLLEELLWRTITGRVTGYFSWIDLYFSGYHILVLFSLLRHAWLLLVFLILAASSAFWRIIARRSSGLVVPILTHTAADAGVILFAHLLLKNG